MRLIKSRSTKVCKNIKLVIIGNNIEEVLEESKKDLNISSVWQVKERRGY